MSSIFLNNFIFFTPLEQFDETTWLSHRVLETVEPYVLFISEMDFDVRQRYTNPNNEASSTISFAFSIFYIREADFYFYVFIVFFIVIFWQSIKQFTEGFTYLFFLGVVHLITGVFITVWFTEFVFIDQEISAVSFELFNITNFKEEYFFSPQIDFTFGIDQRRITLLLGFFLIGGNDAADEDDFLLSDVTDLNVVEDVVAPLFVANLGKNVAENGSLYLKVCSIFGFVLISNLRGMIPYGDTATSSLILTFWVALSVFSSLVTLMIRKHGFNYFFSLFRPSGCPFPLIFLLVPIEFLSYSFRLVSLSVRLFANRRAGHTLIKVLIGFSYVRFTLGDTYAVAAFLPALVVFVLIFLERAVAGIQAYIFTILTCIYLKDLYVSH